MSNSTATPQLPGPVSNPDGEHKLQSGAISAAGSVVMAVAGSAPAYSIAATTAALIAAAGLASPAALLWCGIPMVGIAVAFAYLGKAEVNAGAAYSWVGRALHPALGFLCGWALVISATIFMVAGSLPAGSMTLALFSPENANNVPLSTGIGAIWFLVMVVCVMLGATLTARAQWIMSSIEVVILVVFALVAIIKAATGAHAGPSFSWDWFGFGHFQGTGGFVAAALIAAFYYWGWDVSANLNEETENGHKNSGLGGIIGVVIVFLLFEVFTIGINVMLPAADIEANSGNVLGALGEVIWPGIGGKILIVAVMLSTIATLETTLIQVTRSLFAMGRDKTLPAAFGRSHAKWRTPAFATVVVACVSLVLFIGSNFIGSIGDILSAAISSIGLQIAFYYCLAALAVVVAYRKLIFKSWKNFIFIGLWPGVGAVFMGWIFVVSIPTLGGVVVAIGLGTLALGLIPMAYYWRKGSSYFTRRPLNVS
jgi:amino acid transporter